MIHPIFAIDPGPEESAWVLYDPEGHRINEFSNGESNDLLRTRLHRMLMLTHPTRAPRLVVEMIASYGMPVGMSTFETCVWIGRFVEAWSPRYDWRCYRIEVKTHVCHDSRAKDANVRRALMDRFPVGNKKNPGPGYGISGDGWAALGVAVTAAEGGIHHKSIAEQVAAMADRRTKKREKKQAAVAALALKPVV